MYAIFEDIMTLVTFILRIITCTLIFCSLIPRKDKNYDN